MTRILIAPDKFKGTLTAQQVADALAEGIGRTAPRAEVIRLPIADGGDGTVQAALAAGFEDHSAPVAGPTGETVLAHWAQRGDLAVLELAETSGLRLLPGGRKDHARAHTRGLGELMLAARDAGATTLTIGIGGSASTDGGAGMLQVLGARLLDPSGEPIAPGHDALTDLATADLTPALQALEGIDLIAACDVTSPLLGPEGAAAVFGPQKGLRRSAIDEADARLRRLSDLLDPSGAQRDREGAGAAGGTGFGLMLLGAGFTSGADAVLDLLDLDAHLDGVDLVVTGEGHLDAQTLHGKGPAEVARRAHAAGIDVLAVAGALSLRPEDLASIGISRAASLVDRAGSTTQAIQRGRELLVEVGEELGRTL